MGAALFLGAASVPLSIADIRGAGNVFIDGRRIQVIRRSDGLGRLIVD